MRKVCAKSLGQRLIPLKRIPRLSRKTFTQLRRRKRPLPLYLDGIRGSGAVRAAKPYARLLRYELQPVAGTTIERCSRSALWPVGRRRRSEIHQPDKEQVPDCESRSVRHRHARKHLNPKNKKREDKHVMPNTQTVATTTSNR